MTTATLIKAGLTSMELRSSSADLLELVVRWQCPSGLEAAIGAEMTRKRALEVRDMLNHWIETGRLE